MTTFPSQTSSTIAAAITTLTTGALSTQSIGVMASSSHASPSLTGLVTVKLSHDTHLLWKAQILPALRGAHWMAIADGSEPAPDKVIAGEEGAPPVPNPEYISWVTRDQHCLSFLLSTLSTTRFCRAHVMQLRRQLATVQKRDMSMMDYFTKVKGLTDALAAAGKQLDEEDIVIYLLTGLGSSYDPLVTSVTTRADAISLNDLYSHMLDFEIRHQHHDHVLQLPGSGGSSVNNVSRNSGGGNGGGGDGKRGRNSGGNRNRNGVGGGGGGNHRMCGSTGHNHNCGDPNHNHTNSCNSGGGGRNGGKNADVFCQLCKRHGHDVFDCYKRFDHSFVRKERSANNASTGQGYDPAWYLDSGATDHITGDLDKLTMHERYTAKDQVHTENGSGSGFEEGSSLRGH
ncbi:hypothetical protein VPH35_068074 [Triticum aestivum]